MTTHHRVRARSLALALATAAAIAVAAATSALAARSGATTIRGTQLALGTCENGGYAMTGALVGCWWIDTFESASDPTKAHYVATGTEHFTGCLGPVCGTFFTTYRFTAKTAGAWADGAAEIHGRCHHPVVGGTEGFDGASGEISFHDVVDVTPPYYPYWGSVHLRAGITAAPAGAAKRSAGSSAAVEPATSGTTC